MKGAIQKGAIQEVIDMANVDIRNYKSEIAELKRDKEKLIKMLESAKKENWLHKEPYYHEYHIDALWVEFKKQNKL